MHVPVTFSDHNIVAINTKDATIVISQNKKLHTIDLKNCAENFTKEYNTSNGLCVGDRNIEKNYVRLYTNGIPTVISFKRFYVFGKKILFGNRKQRFMQFQTIMTQLGYTTYDLT